MIEAVQHIPLKNIADERGNIMHMLRSTDAHFQAFGEVYFSWINPGIAKAWQKHSIATVNITVPLGAVSVVVYDNREGSATFGKVHEYVLTPEAHSLLSVPPGVWYGYFSRSDTASLIANCSTHPHDPGEQEKLPLHNDIIPYKVKI